LIRRIGLSPMTLGSAIPIANQYAPQWLFCDASEDCFDTAGFDGQGLAGKARITIANQLLCPVKMRGKP
jgi:hypothetical protein